MKLYLHIGTEKTGSSFLQSYLANHRDLLKSHNIYFPKAGLREANMLNGTISPGNASELNSLLEKNKIEEVKRWMQKKYQEAETNNCSGLLLSNEILSITFSKKDVLKSFLNITASIGFKCPNLLLIIREPVSQALSLYKHRTKGGVMLPIQKWLEEKYILADSLDKFYSQISKLGIDINQFPYQKDSFYLIDLCINKWLNFNKKIEVQHKVVNPSLTLSELSLLCDIYKEDRILSRKYYNFMLKIDPKLKSDNQFFEKYTRNHINNFLVNYNEVWQNVYQKMNLQTELYHYKRVDIKESDNIISFSPTQIKVISEFVIYSGSFKYFMEQQIENLKKIIVKITPKLVFELREKWA